MNKAAENGSVTAPSRASNYPFNNGTPNRYSGSENNTSQPSSRQPTGNFPSPAPQRTTTTAHTLNGNSVAPHTAGAQFHKKTESGIVDPEAFEDWDDDQFTESDPLNRDSSTMPSDLRPPFHRPTDGKSGTPLLDSNHKENGYADGQMDDHAPGLMRRRSTFKERDPDAAAKAATRKRYSYAAFFLAVSLVSFTIQTETAVYIKKYLNWKKSYAML